MSRDFTRVSLESAMLLATQSMRAAMQAANELTAEVEENPEMRGHVSAAVAQLFAVADVARDVERQLATVHARRREETGLL